MYVSTESLYKIRNVFIISSFDEKLREAPLMDRFLKEANPKEFERVDFFIQVTRALGKENT